MGLFNEGFDNKIGIYLLVLIISAVTLWVFSEVLWSIFFAVTLAYVIHPFNLRLQSKGFSRMVSTIISTLVMLLGFVLLALPVLIVLYRRREVLIGFLQDLPQTIEISILNFDLVVRASQVIDIFRDSITGLALDIAQSAPSIALKTLLVFVLVFAILNNTSRLKSAVDRSVPESFQEILYRYHFRTEKVIRGLYIVQAATAILTFIIGMPVFYFLGYEPFISLALVAGILQFIPVLGPMVLIFILTGFEIIMGEVIFGITVLLIGLLLVALLPDLIVRPRLADHTAGISPGLYLLGFIGGILKLGAIGIIVGPLMIALFIETVEVMGDINQKQ